MNKEMINNYNNDTIFSIYIPSLNITLMTQFENNSHNLNLSYINLIDLNNIFNLNNTNISYADDLNDNDDDDDCKSDSLIENLTKISRINAGKIQIPFYTIILLLSIIGNLLVISTLIQNYRMRTITNLFLLNLAISDILLGVLCMPFTLVGTLLRAFVFGEFLCKLIPFLQATSVAVSSWTLVAISCERYYAICHPLRSRSWQTIKHAYKIIAFIWLGSFLCMLPIAGFSQLIPTNSGLRKKCREQWPQDSTEQAYNIFLDLILLVIPLIILCVTYFLITKTLYMGIQAERNSKGKKYSSSAFNISLSVKLQQCHEIDEIKDENVDDVDDYNKNGGIRREKCGEYGNKAIQHGEGYNISQQQHNFYHQFKVPNQNSHHQIYRSSGKTYPTSQEKKFVRSSSMRFFDKKRNNSSSNVSDGIIINNLKTTNSMSSTIPTTSSPVLRKQFDSILRRSNVAKNLENKQRVIRMLFVLVLEFFICWTPLYVINTITLFYPSLIYQNLGYTAISFFQLLAYSSSCCNPITYCFMNASFRKAFLKTFKGLQLSKHCKCSKEKHNKDITKLDSPQQVASSKS